VAGGGDASAQQLRAAWVHADNDYFDFRLPAHERPDFEYTQGARARLELAGAPGRVERWARAAGLCDVEPASSCVGSSLEVGQEIYNSRKDAEVTMPGHRPYAGWLYLEAGALAATGSDLHAVSVQVGVTGPPSLGETVQTLFHEVYGFREPLGWSDQLATEPGLVARYERSRLFWTGRIAGTRAAELVARAGGDMGNVHTGADAGLRGRLGYAVPHPWVAADSGATVALYVTGGLNGRWVARNIFLDGSTFRSGPRVDKLPFIAEYEGGIALRVGSVTAEYSLLHRSREYRTQWDRHTHGSLRLGVRTRGAR
jgi:lipid A 3-O-deacylase